MKVLVTAFEPFNNDLYNPSLDVLEQLHDVEKIVLPVSYIRAKPLIDYYLNRLKPDYVIHLGLAKGRNIITIEEFAVNMLDAKIKDNDLTIMQYQKIANNKEVCYQTPFDLASLVACLDHKCQISYHAGTFICNLVYFCSLAKDYKAMFIHLPADTRFEGDNFFKMPLSEMVEVVQNIVDMLNKDLVKLK